MTSTTGAFGNYRLLERIGDGPTGDVFRAVRDEGSSSDQVFALKRVHPVIARDPGFARSFAQGASRSRRLSSPHLASVVDHGELQGSLFAVTPFRDGYPLSRILAHQRLIREPFAPHQVVHLMVQLCEALAVAHRAQADRTTPWPMVHGDIKPSNILIDASGFVSLLDLGIGVPGALEPEGTLIWLSRESLGFLAPEQVRGAEIDPRTDVYTLGALMFELLTLEPYIELASPMVMMQQILEIDLAERTRLLKDLGPHHDFSRLVQGSLQRKPKARFPDAAALGEALAALDRTGMQDPAEYWARLLSVLDQDPEARIEAAPLRLLAGEAADSIEPWDINWMESAFCSDVAWRLVEGGPAARVFAASEAAMADAERWGGAGAIDADAVRLSAWSAAGAPGSATMRDSQAVHAAGGEPVEGDSAAGIYLLDDAELGDDDGWDTRWDEDELAEAIARGDAASAAASAAAAAATFEAAADGPMTVDARAEAHLDYVAVEASAPLEMRAEDLEDTSDLAAAYDEEEEEYASETSISVTDVLHERDFNALERALAQLELRNPVERSDRRGAVEPEVVEAVIEAEAAPARSEAVVELEAMLAEEERQRREEQRRREEETTGRRVLTGRDLSASSDDFMTTALPDTLMSVVASADAEMTVEGLAIEAASEEDDLDTFQPLRSASGPIEVAVGEDEDEEAVAVGAAEEAIEVGGESADVVAAKGPGAAVSMPSAEDARSAAVLEARTAEVEAAWFELGEELEKPPVAPAKPAGSKRGERGGRRGGRAAAATAEVQARAAAEASSKPATGAARDERTVAAVEQPAAEILEVAAPEAGIEAEPVEAIGIATDEVPVEAAAAARGEEEALLEAAVAALAEAEQIATNAGAEEEAALAEADDAAALAEAEVVAAFGGDDHVETGAVDASEDFPALSAFAGEDEITDEVPVVADSARTETAAVAADEGFGARSRAPDTLPSVSEAALGLSGAAGSTTAAATTGPDLGFSGDDEEEEDPAFRTLSEHDRIFGEPESSIDAAVAAAELEAEEAPAPATDEQPEAAELWASDGVETDAELFTTRTTAAVESGWGGEAGIGAFLNDLSGPADEAPAEPLQTGLVDLADIERGALPAPRRLRPDDEYDDNTLAEEIDAAFDIRIFDEGGEMTFDEDLPFEVEALSVSDMAIPDEPSASSGTVDLVAQQVLDGRREDIPEELQLPNAPALDLPNLGLEIEAMGAEEAFEALEADEEPEEPEPAARGGQRGRGKNGRARREEKRKAKNREQSWEGLSTPGTGVRVAEGRRGKGPKSGEVELLGGGVAVSTTTASGGAPGSRGGWGETEAQAGGARSGAAAGGGSPGDVRRTGGWYRPQARRPVLTEGTLLQGRFQVGQRLLDLPEKSFYEVSVIESDSSKMCFVCGYANNLVEDTHCYKCRSPLVSRRLNLSLRWDPRRIARDLVLAERELDHPGISRIYGQFTHEGNLCRVLEPITGQLLLQVPEPLDVHALIEIGSQSAEALAYLHDNGISSPSLGAENIYLHNNRVQLYDIDVDEVTADASTLSASVRMMDVMALARALIPYTPPDVPALVNIMRDAVGGRITRADQLSRAIEALANTGALAEAR